MATRRAVHGDGTIYQRASDQRWVGSFLVEGKRKYVYGKHKRKREKNCARRRPTRSKDDW
jgi:hypothetical protein